MSAFYFAPSRIGRRFKPALRRNNIGPPVAVDITRADSVTIRLRAHHMLHELAVLHLVPGGGRCIAQIVRQQFLGFPVIIKINQKCELDELALIDGVFPPSAAFFAGILHPNNPVLKTKATDDVRVAILVDIQRKVAEVGDVAVLEFQIPEAVRRPRPTTGPLVPLAMPSSQRIERTMESARLGDQNYFLT